MAKLAIVLSIALYFLLFTPPVSPQKNDPIKLHVFLFSHMDEGWIYTFENYYTGTNSQDGGCVRCIFNNVYDSLLKDPNRKYQLSEVAFLNRWWTEQPQERRDQFKKFVAQKQVQFVNSGWGANDEACAYYEDIIDQFILGFRWVKAEFDVDPDVGWQIDSFGHSSTHAALMAQAGFKGLFFGRVDYQDWENRRKEKTLEFNWKPQNPHNESIVAHLLYTHYSDTKFMVPDNYYCRSIFCHGRLGANGLQKVTDYVRKQSESFRTKNVALLVGDDFHLWQESEKDFDGIENMIQYFSDNPELGIQAKFSTLNEYVEEFDKDFMTTPNSGDLPVYNGDFFPYIENEWTSWVGYYTSKAMFKLKVREMSQYYNAAKLLLAKFMLGNNKDVLNLDANKFQEIDNALHAFEDILAVVQHHDAISGTHTEKVKEDYSRTLDNNKKSVEYQIHAVLKPYSEQLVGEKPVYTTIDSDWRQKDPSLVTIFDQNKKVLVNVFNPGEKDKFLIKIKVPTYKHAVLDDLNNYVVVDIMCNSEDAKEDCYIYFVDEIPAYSLKTYIVMPAALSKRVIPEMVQGDTNLAVGNQVILKVKANLRDFTYHLCPFVDPFNITTLMKERKCIEDTFNLNYEYYESHIGSGTHVSSGAYIFQPRKDDKQEYSSVRSGRVFKQRP